MSANKMTVQLLEMYSFSSYKYRANNDRHPRSNAIKRRDSSKSQREYHTVTSSPHVAFLEASPAEIQSNRSVAIATANIGPTDIMTWEWEWPMRRPAAYAAEWQTRLAVTCRTYVRQKDDGRITSDKWWRSRKHSGAGTERKRKNWRYTSNARDTYGVLKKPAPFTLVTNEVVSFEGHECDIKRRSVVSRRWRSEAHVTWLSIVDMLARREIQTCRY